MSENKSENTYIGLTIGPIVKILGNARQSRELWGASYLFSYFMKQIIHKLRDERDFIIPFVDKENKEGLFINVKHYYGTGLFPDVLIFKQKDDNDEEILKSTIVDVIKEFVEKESAIFADFKDSKQDDIVSYFRSFYQFSIVRKQIEEVDGNTKNNMDMNPVINLGGLLELKELQSNFIIEETSKKLKGPDKKDRAYNYLTYYLTNINKSKLKKEAFDKIEDRKPFDFEANSNFPSVSHISTIELAHNDIVKGIWKQINKKVDNSDELDLITELKSEFRIKKLTDQFKFRHKYFCIVYADGDNIGKTIKKLKGLDKFEAFSKSLFEFAKESTEMIAKFGGKSIYVGGDDLLFFAPVVDLKGEITIFSLLDELDECFSKIMEQFINNFIKDKTIVTPTLSFGLSVSYHKHPLYEALETSRNLLFGNAKKYFFKNAICTTITKHSGQIFEINISKRQSESFKHFLEMTTRYFGSDSDKKLFTTLMHKLAMFESILKEIISNKNSLDNFFENYFNEQVHKTEKGIEFKKDVSKLLHLLNTETTKLKENYIKEQIEDFNNNKITQRFLIASIKRSEKIGTIDAQLKNFYNILRTIHFIQQEDNEG